MGNEKLPHYYKVETFIRAIGSILNQVLWVLLSLVSTLILGKFHMVASSFYEMPIVTLF